MSKPGKVIEYILPVNEGARNTDEMFVGVIRSHHQLIRCKDCQGYDEGRCHWWYDDPEVPADGYCFQAEKKEEAGS